MNYLKWFYQPIYDIEKKSFTCVEALIRSIIMKMDYSYQIVLLSHRKK